MSTLPSTRRLTLLPLFAAVFALPAQQPVLPADPPPAASLPPSQTLPDTLPTVTASISAPSPLSRDEQILHLLNRFTYGPRPGDLERIRASGINKWLSAQFNPQTIDDSALDRRLADYPAMQLPIERLMEQYPNNQMIRAAQNNHSSIPRGEGEKAIYKAETERLEDRRKKTPPNPSDSEALPDTPEAILAQDPKTRFSTLCHLTPPQLRALRQQLSPAHGDPDRRDQLTAGFTPRQIEELAAIASPQGVVASELVQTKLLRDIYSERQLQEVMTDFWLNHFNVFIRKSQEAPYLITAYERDTIRPHALGHFEQLLVATAVSPAMLNYLDNAQSIGPNCRLFSPELTYVRGARRPAANTASGLNENYARELMELHTLGVNGGYTQHDVTEVAKIFTGWTLDRNYGQERGLPAVHAFFDPLKHEPGNKTVLGTTIKDGGSTEGMKLLHLLAQSPQTARFISTKLAIRFVSDSPPPSLIDSMVAAWVRTNGDIRQVLLAMIQSPDFFTRETYRAKVKTPQDYIVSAVRASGAEVVSAGAVAASLADLGMPVYGMQTPNGYSMRSDAWNNTSALVSRMNFALALSADRLNGVHSNWPTVTGVSFSTPPGQLSGTPSASPEQTDALLEDKLLHQRVSDRTRATILTQISTTPDQQRASLRQIAAKNAAGRDPLTAYLAPATRPADILDPQTALTAGLLFGSPEFQRR